ncbi:DEAD/DEAH box helicase [Acinetobacter baumannii]|nr:DEAD/DEAH box helicase [Acinetobacter baumannii]
MNNEQIDLLIKQNLEPDFKGRLLDRGLSRSMIWKDGILPENAPHFSEDLSYDLLTYGYALLSLAIKSTEKNGDVELRLQAFEKAAIALMVVVNNGEENYTQRSFHILLSASAYHLAHYSAKAYSLLKKYNDLYTHNILEKALSFLITRDLKQLTQNIPIWKQENQKDLDRLTNPEVDSIKSEMDSISANLNFINLSLINIYLESIYEFLDALEVGSEKAIENIEKNLSLNISISQEYNFLEEWWIFRITKYLLRDLWLQTYHHILPIKDSDTNWSKLRYKFIKNLLKKKNAEIDLWPSQIEGAKSAINDSENLIVSLPTSSGKTRIAELCILRALSQNKKVIFITPLRALSVQTEITLMNTFKDMDIKVSSLYGGQSLYGFQKNQFEDSEILIGTPEKLDFILKNDPVLLNDVGLVVLDEGHMLGLGGREIKFEVLVQNLLNRPDSNLRRIVCLSAILPSGSELDDFVDWISYPSEGKAISSDWRPTDLRFGEIYGTNESNSYRLDFTIGEQNPFIPKFIEKKLVRPRVNFPNNSQDLTLAVAHKYINDKQSILIYCPEKKSVNSLAKRLIKIHDLNYLNFDLRKIQSPYYFSALSQGEELLGENHIAILCLKLGIVIHHGGLPKDYRTAIELLIKHSRVSLIISSPTLAQGLNLQTNIVLFNSIFRAGQLIPSSEFRNVIGRAGRSFVDLQGIVLFPNYGHILSKTKNWNSLIRDKDKLTLNSGLGLLIVQLILRIASSLKENNIYTIYEYIVNSNYSFDFPQVAFENQDDVTEANVKWKEYLGLLDYSIINLIGDEDVAIENVAEFVDILLKNSFLYKQIRHLSNDKQMLIKSFIQKRSEYLWKTTTYSSRQQLYYSGVSLDTINNNDKIINDILYKINEIDTLLIVDEFNYSLLSNKLIQLAELVFSISEFTPKKIPEHWDKILYNWLNGLNYLVGFDVDVAVDFIEKNISYNFIMAIEFFKARCSLLSEYIIEQSTFDYISQVFEYGVLDRNALFLIGLGLKSRVKANEISRFINFPSAGKLLKWLSEANFDNFIDTFGQENIQILKNFASNIKSTLLEKEDRILRNIYVNWKEVDPLDYIFTNIKLLNINGITCLISRKAQVIGSFNFNFKLDLMSEIFVHINSDFSVDIRYKCSPDDSLLIVENR